MAAPTYFGSAAVPADGASAVNATATITVTPPASMLAGDLVVVVCASLNSATWSNGVTGGQVWTAETAFSGTAGPYCRLFWCRFNGTWAANPRFDSTSATCTSAIMHVFRPDQTTDLWAFDVAQASTAFAAPSTPFTVTRTGLTTAHTDCVSLACWASSDDNTWGTLSGTGWTATGTAQYRNTSGQDQSLAFAHHLDSATSTAVPNVSLNQATLGGDAGVSAIMSWYASTPTGAYIVQSKTLVNGAVTTVNTVTFDSPTTAGNAIVVIYRPEATVAGNLTVPPVVTDNNSNTYQVIGWTDFANEQSGVAAAATVNISGRSGHIITITHTSNIYLAAKIYELSGVPTTLPLLGGATVMSIQSGVTTIKTCDLLPDNNGLCFAACSATGTGRTITPTWTGATEDAELDEANTVSGTLAIARKAGTAGTIERPTWSISSSSFVSCAIAFVIRDAGTTVPTGVRIQQSVYGIKGTSGTTRPLRFTAPTTTGNAILVIGQFMQASAPNLPSPTIADNAGNTYLTLVDVNFGTNLGSRLCAFVAENATGHSALVVTVNFSAATWAVGKAYELANVPTSSLTTGTAVTNTGISNTPSSGNMTPADAGMHFAAMGYYAGGSAMTPNWSGAVEDCELDEGNAIAQPINILRKAAVASSAQNAAWTTLAGNAWAAFNFAIRNAPVGFALTDNLAGYWKLDEASGSRADSSGLGSTLTQSSGTISGAAGKISNGASFVSANARWLTCVNNSNLQMGDIDFTIALWVKLDSVAGSKVILDKDNGTNYEYSVYYSASTLRFYLDRSGGSAGVTWPPTISTGTWYFVVVVHDSVGDRIKISVDNGTFVDSAFFNSGPAITTGNLYLGADSSGAASNLDGTLDEVGIWKRALSASEITQLYNGGAGLTYPFTGVAAEGQPYRKRTGGIPHMRLTRNQSVW